MSHEFTDILWVQTSFLGDIVLSTSAFESARKLFPGVRQHIVTTSVGKEILEESKVFEQIFVLRKRQGFGVFATLRLVGTIRNRLKGRRVVVLCAHRSPRSTLFCKALGFHSVGYRESAFSTLYSKTIPRVAVLHEVERIAILLEGLGAKREDYFFQRPMLPTVTSTNPAIVELTESQLPLVAIAPGSVWGTKMWPTVKYAKLVSEIFSIYHGNVGVVLLGSENEKVLTDSIYDAVSGRDKKLWNLAGMTDLKDLLGLYPLLSMIVCNDSSPLHFAAAYNVPSLAIFGSTIPQMGFGPRSERSDIAEVSSLDCRPCSAHGPMHCPKDHFRCMQEINVSTVFQRLQNLLVLPVS